MCGIAGLITEEKIDRGILEDMIGSLEHRGPDDTGYFTDGNMGLGHTRLGIMDPQYGKQPISNEDESIIVTFNGEIYNHLEIRRELEARGHSFKNRSDTAILPHMYEEYGTGMFERLNGQFAIALWSRKEGRLVLGRDRLGEKPLYYYLRNSAFCFASEAKAIFKSGLVRPRVSPVALKQVFSFWSTLSDCSIFEGIYQVPPGNYMVLKDFRCQLYTYWELVYTNGSELSLKNSEDYEEELEHRLRESVKARLMSDVPVSFYLSGGLDSSLVAGMAAGQFNQTINTFSITFDNNQYDESEHQEYMARYLGSNHKKVQFVTSELPATIREVIYHTEMPLLRSGSFPMYTLAKLVRSNGIKVALSGEGSDELFGGYDIFREAKIREFCRRSPDSFSRSVLFKRVNNFVKGLDALPAGSLSMFYNRRDSVYEKKDSFSEKKASVSEKKDSGSSSWHSSHDARWRMGIYSRQFFSAEYRERMKEYDEVRSIEELLPEKFMNWTPVQRAQYLEVTTFFSNYLLSSQGDRVSMANSVECRYPFLDYGLVEFANALPDRMKIKVLNEKYIVKKMAEKYLPKTITARKKFPYRAPIDVLQLIKDEYVRDMLGRERLQKYGIFNPVATERFLDTIRQRGTTNERDNMLFMGLLTTQILCECFLS